MLEMNHVRTNWVGMILISAKPLAQYVKKQSTPQSNCCNTKAETQKGSTVKTLDQVKRKVRQITNDKMQEISLSPDSTWNRDSITETRQYC